MSGGHECVLVKWHFGTQNRDFLPRLSAPINSLICSKDNTLLAIAQEDNGKSLKLSSKTKIVWKLITFCNVCPHITFCLPQITFCMPQITFCMTQITFCMTQITFCIGHTMFAGYLINYRS